MKLCERCGKPFDPKRSMFRKEELRRGQTVKFCANCQFRNLTDGLGLPTPPEMLDKHSKRPTLSDEEYRRELAKPVEDEE